MKRFLIPIAALLIFCMGYTPAKSKNSDKNQASSNTVASLMKGVKSNVTGLKTSSAAMLGDLKESKAVVPLMNDLKSHKDERARIQAAIALWKIGDARGIYSIKQAVRFDQSERVRRICKILYLDSIETSKVKF